MNGYEIRLAVKNRAYDLMQQHGLACHVAVSETTTGHCHILFATTAHFHAAKERVLGWAYRQVPIEAVERHLAALDRKIRKLQNGVVDGS